MSQRRKWRQGLEAVSSLFEIEGVWEPAEYALRLERRYGMVLDSLMAWVTVEALSVMRMWNVDPKLLCRKHLLGEHVEMHMFVGTMKKGLRLTGYIDGGLIETANLWKRHEALAKEMVRRGYKHNSPLEKLDVGPNEGHVDVEANLKELARRCVDCRMLIEGGR